MATNMLHNIKHSIKHRTVLQSKYTVRNVHILVKSHRSEDILKRLILLKSITVFKLLGNSQFSSPTFSICSGLL